MQQTIFVSFTNDHQVATKSYLFLLCIANCMQAQLQPVWYVASQVAGSYCLSQQCSTSSYTSLAQESNKVFRAMCITIIISKFFFTNFPCVAVFHCVPLSSFVQYNSLQACITLFEFELTLKGGKHCTQVFERFFVVLQFCDQLKLFHLHFSLKTIF